LDGGAEENNEKIRIFETTAESETLPPRQPITYFLVETLLTLALME
jgi:hypothetical protein